jgi:hypothetical protein
MNTPPMSQSRCLHPICSPPFADRQKVDAKRYDATNPKWNHMGICTVVGQRRARCESGWMVNIMSKDGTSMELDSHWLSGANGMDEGRRTQEIETTTEAL